MPYGTYYGHESGIMHRACRHFLHFAVDTRSAICRIGVIEQGMTDMTKKAAKAGMTTKKKASAKAELAPDVAAFPVITSIKGFDANLSCRGFQFEIGKTYEVSGNIRACHNGFHACPEEHHPLSVFEFYPPAGSRYCIVEQAGESDARETKLASAKITIGFEISLGDLAQRAVKWVFDRVDWTKGAVATAYNEGATASGTRGAATASGTQGAATASGYQGAATASGHQGAATASGTQGAATASGTQGAATASGHQGAATASGERGAATASGHQGAATASGDQGAATASGTHGAATASGDQSAATASGTHGAATASGERGAATASGYRGIACALGHAGKAKASASGAIVLVARKPPWVGGEILHIVAAKVGDAIGGVTIKPDTFYRLTDDGRVKEVEG